MIIFLRQIDTLKRILSVNNNIDKQHIVVDLVSIQQVFSKIVVPLTVNICVTHFTTFS